MPQPYSRSNPSPRFVELLEQYRAMHREGDVRRGTPAEHTFDGKSLPRQASRIKKMIERSGARTILDYGSGKGRQYLPAGITRHLIRWRALRVNIPVGLCEDTTRTLDQKNAWLEAYTEERLRKREVRFYEEPTVLYDE